MYSCLLQQKWPAITGTQATGNLQTFLPLIELKDEANATFSQDTAQYKSKHKTILLLRHSRDNSPWIKQFYPEAFPNLEATFPGPDVVIKFPLADM